MPLGDPCGGNFQYTIEGLPENIISVIIPVKDIKKSLKFYTDLLMMNILVETEEYAVIRRSTATIILKKSNIFGIDTRVFIGVENPYDLHRRLVDEGVIFTRDPMKSPVGVYTSFKDDDGNILHAVDMNFVKREYK